MVQVSQDQKRVMKKFVALGYERGTLLVSDILDIHYLLTQDNEGVPEKEKAPHSSGLEWYWTYYSASSSGLDLGLNGMWEIWHKAREVAVNQQQRDKIDEEARNVFRLTVGLDKDRGRLVYEKKCPTALLPDCNSYAMVEHDDALREWYYTEMDRRDAEYAKRVSTMFLAAIRKAPNTDALACRGVLRLANLAYAHWHLEKRLFTTKTNIDDEPNWEYFDSLYKKQLHKEVGVISGDVVKALDYLVAAYSTGKAPDCAYKGFHNQRIATQSYRKKAGLES